MFDFETPGQAVFLANMAGNISTWNAGCASLFGMPAGDVIGLPVTTLIASGQEAWLAVLQALARQADAPEPPPANLRIEADLHCAEGRIFHVSMVLAPQQGTATGDFAVAVETEYDPEMPEAARVARIPLASIVDLLPGNFYTLNREGRFVLWNRNLERVTEMMPDELAAAHATDLLDPPQRQLLLEGMHRVFDLDEEVNFEVDYVSKSGRETPFLLCGSKVRCDGNEYLFGMGIDISERRTREETLRLRERALHAASNGIVITRCGGPADNLIEYVNPAFERITGYPAAEVTGRDPRFMAVPGMDLNERALLREAIVARRAVNVVLRNLRKNGELFWNDLNVTPVRDEHGAVTHYIGVINDVTALKQRTAHLEHEVNHDALTGLANRNLMWDRLEQALHLAQRQKSLVATVLLDLNNFKAINDTHGHEAGDVVLKVVARRLQASVRDSDTVARMSGDEFVLVLANQPSLRYTLRMIERVRASFAIPVNFNGREIAVGASLGVSLYPHDGATATELVRAADVAMYHGKGNPEGGVHFFSADMRSSTEAKHKIERDLRHALDHDELFLLYQPRVAIGSGKITGFEALLRWRHPEQGELAPPRFLAEAEENGLIVQIGQRVLDQGCAFAARLGRLGTGSVPLTVNVSYREYSQPNFVADMAAQLERHRLPPHSLQLDLRMEALVRNPALGRELAAQLREHGVGLSVDAFGSGLCDLGYLQQLEARQVKLDAGTVHALGEGSGGAIGAIAKSLIDIGHNLDMDVIGEAVETRPQMECLKSLGCDQLQGMWFSQPLSADEAFASLESQRALHA
ncbi:EAL domain-containing protein [Massilia forsythiae]|uniref:EAL domain-containing protein n=1 Tax=Massilia forsythiae TaxID=2728020 RepID=A0A7Z2ZQS3_9BURK|nr:EAL domain-containing protein [Massilia forsythiae]QJD98720.1 EAL domain-containing protein [Massilia forsythiae]